MIKKPDYVKCDTNTATVVCSQHLQEATHQNGSIRFAIVFGMGPDREV